MPDIKIEDANSTNIPAMKALATIYPRISDVLLYLQMSRTRWGLLPEIAFVIADIYNRVTKPYIAYSDSRMLISPDHVTLHTFNRVLSSQVEHASVLPYEYVEFAGGRCVRDTTGAKETKQMIRMPRSFTLDEPLIGAACGADFTIAWTQSASYAWGSNAQGQLGLGDLDNRLLPQRIARSVVTAACGRRYVVMIVYAGTKSEAAPGAEPSASPQWRNRALCWGAEISDTQIGYARLIKGITNPVAVACGDRHAMILSDGDVFFATVGIGFGMYDHSFARVGLTGINRIIARRHLFFAFGNGMRYELGESGCVAFADANVTHTAANTAANTTCPANTGAPGHAPTSIDGINHNAPVCADCVSVSDIHEELLYVSICKGLVQIGDPLRVCTDSWIRVARGKFIAVSDTDPWKLLTTTRGIYLVQTAGSGAIVCDEIYTR